MSIRHLLRVLALCTGLLCAGIGAAQAEVIAHPQTVELPFNRWTDFYFSATDDTPGGPHAITWAIATGPAHGTLNPIIGDHVRYRPYDDYIGQDSFTFTATTANGTSAPATIHITMQGPVPPEAHSYHHDVPFNLPSDIPLRGGNPNWGSSLTVYFELVDPPDHGVATGFGGTGNYIIYTPNPDYTGPDAFTFRVWHEVWGYSNIATISLSVAAPVPPVAYPGRNFAPHGTATPIALTGKDPNPGGTYPLSYAMAAQPAHGHATVSGDIATYTPENGFWGEDSFSFTASSVNGTSAPAAVRVLVGQAVTLGLPGGRNDTGQTVCTDSAGAASACNHPANHPGQDGSIGRDAQAGAAAFDFSPIAGGCVEDRVTNLIWSDETLAARTFADASDTAATHTRCGIASGWRLPTRRELLSIVHHGASTPAIDTVAFPATHSAPYWSADAQGADAWAVDFSDGNTLRSEQTQTHAVRLVTRIVNQAPTLTLGAEEIVLRNDEKPGPQHFPGWATGIGPGAASEAGQQVIATVRLFPVQGEKTLEFQEPPAIDPATGDLSFTVLHRIDPQPPLAGETVPSYFWVSSAGRVRVEVTLQDDGGTEGGGTDTTVRSFEIAVSPVPLVYDVNIKHPWKAACIPVTMHVTDIDTDRNTRVVYPLRYAPLFKIKSYPSRGFLVEYVPRPASALPAGRSGKGNGTWAKSISVPLGDTVDSVDHVGLTGSMRPSSKQITEWGFFSATVCYVPFSSTFVGSDSFTYTAVDVDDNESGEASFSIEIFEVRP